MTTVLAKVYADLIMKPASGKTFNGVPDGLKEQVKTILLERGREDLVTESNE